MELDFGKYQQDDGEEQELKRKDYEIKRPVKKLPADTVRLIQSEQVITDLASVVKELIENGLDAGATRLEIILVNSGLTSIKVKDNGSGIDRADFDCFAKRHHTSKIESFSSLEELTTYGFRGEALSSLCEIAQVKITTRTNASLTGTTLVFDKHGNVSSKEENVQSEVGTTVDVRNIFYNLPVRLETMKRSAQNQVKKMKDLIHTYELIRPDVHFLFRDPPLRQEKAPCTVQETIEELFSPQVRRDLQSIHHDRDANCPFIFDAWLPSPEVGNESKVFKTTNDRCFVYVNFRPVDLPPVTKLFNRFIRDHFQIQKKYGFLWLHIQCDPSEYDVNFTPNKRKLALHAESKLLTKLGEIFTGLYPSVQKKAPPPQNNQTKAVDEDALATQLYNEKNKKNVMNIKEEQPTQLYADGNRHDGDWNHQDAMDFDRAMDEPYQHQQSNHLFQPPPPQFGSKSSSTFNSFPKQNSSSHQSYQSGGGNAFGGGSGGGGAFGSVGGGIGSGGSKRKRDEMDLPGEPVTVDIQTQMTQQQQQQQSQNAFGNALVVQVDLQEIQRKLTEKSQSPIDLLDLTPKLNKEVALSADELKSNIEKCSIVGRLENGLFVLRMSKCMVIFDQYKAEEALIYHKLRVETQLKKEYLAVPATLDRETLGDKLWKIVTSLTPIQTKVLSYNGIEISGVIQKQGKQVVEVRSIPQDIPGSDVNDFVEILQMMTTSKPNAILRPARVRHYFADEAVRMSQKLSPSMSNTDAKDILNRLYKCTHFFTTCPHKQPIFTTIDCELP